MKTSDILTLSLCGITAVRIIAGRKPWVRVAMAANSVALLIAVAVELKELRK